MKVRIQGGNELTLTKANFVASGGEGEVYAKGSTGIKVFHKGVSPIPPQKIQELAPLTLPRIIKPKELVLDQKNQHIGHTFDFIKGTHILCQLFTRAFRDREGVTPKHVHKLIQQLREGIEHVHKSGILIVDCNEMNFLVSNDFEELYFIDVDSYQTPSFPAKVIMPSVRDWHSPKMNENSDWFSFGILAFQMFVGIHPYKGKYTAVRDFEERMKKNISVFHSGVDLPKVCYGLDAIPSGYKDWFKAVFENGVRVPPPITLDTLATVIPKIIQNIVSNVLEVQELFLAGANIREFLQGNGWSSALTSKGSYSSRSSSETHNPVDAGNMSVLGKFPWNGSPFLARFKSGQIEVIDLTSQKLVSVVPCRAENIISFDDRIYVKALDTLLELKISEVGNTPVASLHLVSHILEHASKLFPGCLIQNLLGSTYVTLLPKSGESYSIKMTELDGMKIVDAKYDRQVLIIIVADKKGIYNRFVFRFSENFSSYDNHIVSNISSNGVNFVVADSGVVILLNEDGDLELFSNQIKASSSKIIKDPALSGDLHLFRTKGRIGFIRDNKAYSMRLK